MKSITILLAILIATFSAFSQSEPITLNTKQSLFSINETGNFAPKINFPGNTSEKIQLFVDTSVIRSFLLYNRIFPTDTLIELLPGGVPDTILQIGSRNIQALTACIIYSGEDMLRIQIQDSRIPAVQQALDSSGNWVSLEYFIHSDCGNSYSYAKLTKNESYLFKIGKYTGNYHTKLRLKALINEQIIYSNEFYGSINYEQLNSVYNSKENDEYLFR